MTQLTFRLRFLVLGVLVYALTVGLVDVRTTYAQAGLREALERLDRNQDGRIDPNEITPLARPYLEKIAEARGLSLYRENRISTLQEAARLYHAKQTGFTKDKIQPNVSSTVLPFGADRDRPMVPEFGLAEVKYPYTQGDLDEADSMLRRYDRNGDGYIDAEEARRGDWRQSNPFDFDLNGDNRLSRLELAQRYAQRRLLTDTSLELIRRAKRVGSEVRPSYSTRSSSSSRRGSSRSYYLGAALLDRFDINQDGRLDRKEMEGLGLPIDRIDVNRDGELDRDEIVAYMTALQDEIGDVPEGVPGWFYELDTNGDGQVSMDEFASEWTEEKMQEFARLDTNGDGLLTMSEVTRSQAVMGGVFSNEIAQVLPPQRSIISEIEVQENFPIRHLKVRLSITHTYVSQLDAYLVGPEGQRVELFTEVGGTDDHFDNTIFDDNSRYPITKARGPFRGSFTPEAVVKRQPSLSQFKGKSIQGVWQLVIRGTRSERFGMLHQWSLIAEPQEADWGEIASINARQQADSEDSRDLPRVPAADPNSADEFFRKLQAQDEPNDSPSPTESQSAVSRSGYSRAEDSSR